VTYFRVFPPAYFTDDLVVILSSPLYREIVWKTPEHGWMQWKSGLKWTRMGAKRTRHGLTIIPPRSSELVIDVRVYSSLPDLGNAIHQRRYREEGEKGIRK
jgi:hypothetical protein